MPVILASIGTSVLWLVVRLLLRDTQKAAVLSSCMLLLFFSYGHAWQSLSDSVIGDIHIGRHRYIGGSWTLLFMLALFAVTRIHTDWFKVTRVLNLVGAVLLVVPITTAVSSLLDQRVSLGSPVVQESEDEVAAKIMTVQYPNIYYIILDAYGRDDVLRDIYQYDNTEFLQYLAGRGFYVAAKSNSNYDRTYLSLASSLNYSYLNDILPSQYIDSSREDYAAPLELIRKNRVAAFLRAHGYRFAVYSSGFWGTHGIRDAADIFVTFPLGLNEFQNVLLNTTPLPALLERIPAFEWAESLQVPALLETLGLVEVFPDLGLLTKLNASSSSFQHEVHRRRLLYIFDHLVDIPKTEPPVFVLAHIMLPHPPFVFDTDGSRIDLGIPFTIENPPPSPRGEEYRM